MNDHVKRGVNYLLVILFTLLSSNNYAVTPLKSDNGLNSIKTTNYLHNIVIAQKYYATISLLISIKPIHQLYSVGMMGAAIFTPPLAGELCPLDVKELWDKGHNICSAMFMTHAAYNIYIGRIKSYDYQQRVLNNLVLLNLLGLFNYYIKQKYATQQTTLSIFPTTDGAGIQFAYKF